MSFERRAPERVGVAGDHRDPSVKASSERASQQTSAGVPAETRGLASVFVGWQVRNEPRAEPASTARRARGERDL
jgi:hypothetical protein